MVERRTYTTKCIPLTYVRERSVHDRASKARTKLMASRAAVYFRNVLSWWLMNIGRDVDRMAFSLFMHEG